MSFLIIIAGAALTRYIGFEGVMHIREGESSSEIISQDTYLSVKVDDGEMQYTAEVPVTIDTNDIAYVYPGIKGENAFNWVANLFFDHNNYFDHDFQFYDRKIEITCQDVIMNPKDTLLIDPKGDAYLEVVTAGRNYNFIRSGEFRAFQSGLKVGFNNEEHTDAIKIFETDSGLYVMSPYDIQYVQMADTSQGIIPRDTLHEFIQKRLYVVGNEQFMFNRYFLGARVETTEDKSGTNELMAVTVKVKEGENERIVMLKGGRGQDPRPEFFEMGGLNYKLSFGSIIKTVPFALHLRDFQLERYPGTQNPSSYASEVTLVDPKENLVEDRRIFMNNVLDYGGYRFFQSSYDPDEQGTILSVNKDKPGTVLTYIGYFLLALGFFINLFSKKSRFRLLIKKSRELRLKREAAAAIIFLLSISSFGFGQDNELLVVDEEHADKFAHLIVQDHKGRFKPVHTLAFDLMKKVSRQTTYKGQNPAQVFVGIHVNPFAWFQEPLIYVSGKPLKEKFNVDGKRAALLDFYDPTGFKYLLLEDANKARQKKPANRSEYDKDVLKTDERVSILTGIFNMYYLKIFPKPNDSTNTWYSPMETELYDHEDSTLISGMWKIYVNGVIEGYQTGNWKSANKVVDLISSYQQKTTPAEILPSQSKIDLEVAYNEADLFARLNKGYITVGLILLILNFMQIFIPRMKLKWPLRIGFWLVAALWLAHGTGLGLRWYLSGHAPWSNGYEAVIFIAFITITAGLIFYRQSKIVLGAVCILAWLMLFVAHMNQMDPEMTPLVPVLKSYWLMIHVAIITGSYGFLGLGAILGLLILMMNLFLTRNNKKRIFMTTKELTYVSEMTMTIGLFMLTIGTFLGGVWANESWGRYWGWDAKETWALASVLIYAVVLHLRFIPFFKSQFALNAASLWAYGSIIMTFFGVNFYLSGLHSYAQGDPMPIPTWVPITVWILLALTIISGIRVSKAKKWTSSAKAVDDVS